MSIQLIQKYYAEIDKIIRYGGNCKISKLSVIELLCRVCMVRVETIPLRARVKIIKEMPV